MNHAIIYGGGEGQKLLCQWNVLNNIINEVAIRFTPLGDKMPAAAMNEGTGRCRPGLFLCAVLLTRYLIAWSATFSPASCVDGRRRLGSSRRWQEERGIGINLMADLLVPQVNVCYSNL